MAAETIKRTSWDLPWDKPVAWRVEEDWLYREDEAVVRLPDVTAGSWFAGHRPLHLRYQELVLYSPEGSVQIRTYGSDDDPEIRKTRQLANKVVRQIARDAPAATFRIGLHPLEMAIYFSFGIALVALAILTLLLTGHILGVVFFVVGAVPIWTWRPWTARLNMSPTEVLAEIRKT